MTINIEELLMLSIYASILLGLILIFRASLLGLFQWISASLLRNTKKSRVINHLERIIAVTTMKEKKGNEAEVFVGSCCLLFVFILLLLVKQDFRTSSALLFSFLITGMPYMYLRIKLLTSRLKSSFEGETLMAELLNQYKINHYNMIYAIDKSISCLEKAPLSRQMMYRMARRLKTYKTSEELRIILDDFVYGINTDWSKMLANNINTALIDKSSVEEGLEDLLSQCKDITKILEEGKRNNLESSAIIVFLVPTIYIGLTWSAHQHMGFTIKDIVKYQLMTQTGITMLLAIVIGTFICVAYKTVVENRKFEL